MPRYRKHLPQLAGRTFITDGGLETTMVFHEGVELPHFAAFTLLRDDAGIERLRRYYARYAGIAAAAEAGFMLETPTWRASPDWGSRLGYDSAALEDANRRSVGLLLELRERFCGQHAPVVICGAVGPRGDGYRTHARMSIAAARDYHAWQIGIFADTDADMVAAYTLNYADEAAGIALAARDAGIPAAVSFTVETDGRLPSGESLGAAIEHTDLATGGYPAYYMINCAHPTHFADALVQDGAWRSRIRGVRANASRRTHAELDESTSLDTGDPRELGMQYRELREKLPALSVIGGCCGTDHRHVAAMCEAFAA